MISENYYKNIKETLTKVENKEKYEKLINSNTKEDNKIKFHLRRIENYFKLENKAREDSLNKLDCEVSISEVNSFFEINKWR